MKVFCLGGAGRIAREAILDLVQFSDFETITVADVNEEQGQAVVNWLDDPRVNFVKVNVNDREDTIAKMRGYDIVLDGTTIALNGLTASLIAEAGCHGLNLNGFGDEDPYHDVFVQNNKTFIAGFGAGPGVTQMMAMHAANKLDKVDTVRVSHGAYRPFAFSKAITETTCYEYIPELPTRVVFENGEYLQVPPFSRPREIELPAPYGKNTQYIIPHGETKTLSKALVDKGIQLVECRGTWPQPNMRLLKALYEYGFVRNDEIEWNGTKFGIMDAIGEYLSQSEEGQNTELYGYALHVEVIGWKDGTQYQYIMTHTHPASDGSVEGWEGLRAYTRNVAIPAAIATDLIAKGHVGKPGILLPEYAFDPQTIFEELKKRDLYIHESVSVLSEEKAGASVSTL
ncbi:saccharopine dehydrogenase family protein [Bacillus piscicola]|uniref:saccharopine dehydrogenase family protein n=1 Tax=Bacillus piscicola TaxID=1632684 RepID=UPI001F09D462|nr:saccharopine dehydrogenase C-terminal domain-containing protein [Bacillus piscicola]